MRRSRIRISRGGCRRMTVFHYAIRDISLYRIVRDRQFGASLTQWLKWKNTAAGQCVVCWQSRDSLAEEAGGQLARASPMMIGGDGCSGWRANRSPTPRVR